MPKSKVFIIAIDGFSSCGKSTLAKQLAHKFNLIYVDTGAMYRATTLYFIENDINLENEDEVVKALKNIDITFKNINGINTTHLNGVNIESKIRDLSVSSKVSEVAALPLVRKKMVHLQKNMSVPPGLVMDGRDIGTVVFPDADLKLFITADPKVRANRRFTELKNHNPSVTLYEIENNLNHRDKIDTQRADSPLKQAPDALLVDNTHMTIQEQFELACTFVTNSMNNT